MAMADAEDKASASAMMSFITMIICYAISILLIWIPIKHIMTMPTIFIIIAVLAVLAFGMPSVVIRILVNNPYDSNDRNTA